MTTPSPRPGGPPDQASTLWILMLGSALVALALTQPRRDAAAIPAPEPEPKGNRKPASTLGARSIEGHAARLITATQPERGRHAEHPADIPASGWKDILIRVYLEFIKDRVLAVAAGVTFYTLLALFPGIIALVTLYGLFADASVINEHLAQLHAVLPSGAVEIIGDQVKRIASKPSGTLGLTFFTGLLVSIWSANAAMKAMFDALNAIVVVPVVFNFLGLGSEAWLIAALRWPALLLVILGALSVLYRFGPSREHARWRWVGVGSLVAGLLWLVASLLFSWYVSSFGTYNETYGSLGAVIGFMTWIWISSTIVLLGGEINAEIEHQTGRDTTTGHPLPLGARRARMADTVGAAA